MAQYFGDYIIEEASIMFTSPNYAAFKCRIVDRLTEHLISSNLISSGIECSMQVCRRITDFCIELLDGNTQIAKVQFKEEDLQEGTMFSCKESFQYAKYGSNYIRLKKETDQCSIYFKVYDDDLQKQASPSFFISEYHLKVVNNFYQKITEKAVKRVQKINERKRSNKRFSNCHWNIAVKKAKQNNENQPNSFGFQRIKIPKKTALSGLGVGKKIQIDLNLFTTSRDKQKSNQNFHHLYNKFKQTSRKQLGKSIGFAELISKTLLLPLKKQQVEEEQNIIQNKIISPNGFILRSDSEDRKPLIKKKIRAKNFPLGMGMEKSKKTLKKYNKPLQIRKHKRYTSVT